MVNDKNVVEYRPVELGAEVNGLRVIESGIGPDDWVIINGLQRARPATEVEPERAEMTAPEGVTLVPDGTVASATR